MKKAQPRAKVAKEGEVSASLSTEALTAILINFGNRLVKLEHPIAPPSQSLEASGQALGMGANPGYRSEAQVSSNLIVDRLSDHHDRLCELRNHVEVVLDRLGWGEPAPPTAQTQAPVSRYPDDLLNYIEAVTGRITSQFGRLASKF